MRGVALHAQLDRTLQFYSMDCSEINKYGYIYKTYELGLLL